MHRLFVAIRPPRAHRAALLAAMGGIAMARWQDDAQLHLTLRFVGEVDGRVAGDVADALAGVRHPRFPIALAGVGRFDRRGRADALWAGVTPHHDLAALHRKVDHALVRAGLPPEGRAYLPHVTLARLGRDAGPVEPFLAAAVGLSSDAEEIAAFHLYESRLGHDGATYTIAETYKLIA